MGEASEQTYVSEDSEDSDYVDVPVAVEMISNLIRKDPSLDHIFIDPVAACGHVGRGHIRAMTRGHDLPLDEWFRLGRYMGEETMAVLFTCRSQDLESVGEADLDVARRIAAYSKENEQIAWDLVYVTRTGNYRASDLLRFPGHPRFEPCTYDPEDDATWGAEWNTG